MREIKEKLSKWKDIPCLWIRRLNMVKMAIQTQLIPYQNPSCYFCRDEEDDPKIHMKTEETQKSQNNLENNKNMFELLKIS